MTSDTLETDLKDLRGLLQQALTLELTTIPPYATACYSILQQGQYDRSEPVIVNAEPIEVIRQVMVEEMLHMTLVANVLNAVGGTPVFTANPPTYPATLLDGRGPTVGLRRFTPEQVKVFRKIETAPDGDHGEDYHTIGGFYRCVRKKMDELCDAHGPERVFTGDEARQIGPEDYYGAGGHVIAIRGTPQERRDRALEAIREIMEEGEGADSGGRAGDNDPIPGPERPDQGPVEDIAHFFKFNEILHSRYYRAEDTDVPTGGDLAVDWSAVSPMIDDPTEPLYADHPDIAALSARFNGTWSLLLRELDRAFDGEPARLREAVPVMYRLRDEAQQLMRVPLPGHGGRTAGPTWTYIP
ncbi:ferritin-like domain-containing protein [Halovulum sp. GXIMD14794]